MIPCSYSGFSAIFTVGNNFCDFLFALLKNKTHLKLCLMLLLPQEEILGKNGNGWVCLPQRVFSFMLCLHCTVKLQWLEHLWNHENMFETRIVQSSDRVLIIASGLETK